MKWPTPRNRTAKILHAGFLAGTARLRFALGLATALLLTGCSRNVVPNQGFSIAPTLESVSAPTSGSDTEPFALTNEGRRIEDRLLNRQRASLAPN